MSGSVFLDALQGSAKRPPVWLMRQAGRYMPDYQKIRAQHTLKTLFRTPKLAAEVTRLPLKLLEVDAAILFSDILVICDALGVDWDFCDGKGPILQKVTRADELQNLPAARALSYVGETIALLKEDLNVPLIGFSGGPFTLASYLIEGGSSKDLLQTKKMLYSDPEGFGALLERVTDTVIDLLLLQIRAGVDCVQIFDSWAGMLAPHEFRRYVLSSLQRILQALPAQFPVMLFCRGASTYYESLAALQPTGLSLDWQVDMSRVRHCLGPKIVLQGNLDPALLFGSQAEIQRAAGALLDQMEGDPAFIVNLGHGVLPKTPLENVRFFVDYVKSAYAHKL